MGTTTNILAILILEKDCYSEPLKVIKNDFAGTSVEHIIGYGADLEIPLPWF